MQDVSVAACGSYDEKEVLDALRACLAPIGGLEWVKPGMKVAVKVNLITMMRPDAAATTHPAVIAALVKLLAERGASAIVGDSPGGPFTQAYVTGVYRLAGLKAAEEAGASLNRCFESRQVEFPQAVEAKRFDYTAWLDDADAIIDVCKLKTHGMMAMTAAVKNLFGVIPGLKKADYHYRYPDTDRFADMLVDLYEYCRPRLSIVDAVMAMEGNGPTQGRPRKIGALLASRCAHSVDVACAHVIGLKPQQVPTLAAAIRRGLSAQDVRELTIHGDLERFVCPDFEKIPHFHAVRFYGTGNGRVHRVLRGVARAVLETKPDVKKAECVGCAKCAEVCPAKAIVMENRLPRIDRGKCIRCFCCQELCPKGAMKARQPVAARLLEGGRK